jgi:TRAP-type uncharacterized transport system fused permease subunit
MTGLGMKAANVIVEVSAGIDVLTLLVAAIVTIILGLGMPTPSAYILAAVLVGPALAKIGFPVLESHMFLLYFAILSALTPPIAVAALAAAAIAEEDPIIIALQAVRLAVVGFLVPFVFLWNPAILGQGDAISVALAIAGGVCAAWSIAVAMEWANLPGGVAMAWPIRVALFGVAAASVAPLPLVAICGMLASLALLAVIYLHARRQPRENETAGAE